MTPVVSAILINSTNPFGNIPNKAAAEATTDVLMPASLNQKASTNKIIPRGIITQLVNLETLRIELTNSD